MIWTLDTTVNTILGQALPEMGIQHYITKKTFYIVKLGFTGVYIFSYFCSKTYIVRTR